MKQPTIPTCALCDSDVVLAPVICAEHMSAELDRIAQPLHATIAAERENRATQAETIRSLRLALGAAIAENEGLRRLSTFPPAIVDLALERLTGRPIESLVRNDPAGVADARCRVEGLGQGVRRFSR